MLWRELGVYVAMASPTSSARTLYLKVEVFGWNEPRLAMSHDRPADGSATRAENF
jgi:hypothetical protein